MAGVFKENLIPALGLADLERQALVGKVLKGGLGLGLLLGGGALVAGPGVRLFGSMAGADTASGTEPSALLRAFEDSPSADFLQGTLLGGRTGGGGVYPGWYRQGQEPGLREQVEGSYRSLRSELDGSADDARTRGEDAAHDVFRGFQLPALWKEREEQEMLRRKGSSPTKTTSAQKAALAQLRSMRLTRALCDAHRPPR